MDKANKFPGTALRVNALGANYVAQVCKEINAVVVHISTDFVFGQVKNRKKPYNEKETPGPVNSYGVSKLAGEEFIRATCPEHMIIRTCGLYGNGNNFIKKNARIS